MLIKIEEEKLCSNACSNTFDQQQYVAVQGEQQGKKMILKRTLGLELHLQLDQKARAIHDGHI